ncbi:MAG: CoA pyrophosphatase [Bacillota bacterium]|nr:CoA pyrophosphatase [Bacillota bacterium]
MFKKIENYQPKRIYQEKEKRCAILIPIVIQDSIPYLLFEIRSHRLKKQPGEICFPGGKMEENDTSSKETALRETKEELLIQDKNIHYIGALDYYLSHNNLRVDVHVAQLIDYQNTYNEEVDSVFTVPLQFFLENEPEIYTNIIQTIPDPSFPFDYIPNGQNYKFSKGISDTPVYRYNNYFIWGLTARILYHNLKYFK